LPVRNLQWNYTMCMIKNVWSLSPVKSIMRTTILVWSEEHEDTHSVVNDSNPSNRASGRTVISLPPSDLQLNYTMCMIKNVWSLSPVKSIMRTTILVWSEEHEYTHSVVNECNPPNRVSGRLVIPLSSSHLQWNYRTWHSSKCMGHGYYNNNASITGCSPQQHGSHKMLMCSKLRYSQCCQRL
jgi:hypothetical protein